MTHNTIHQTLMDMSSEQGWNQDSQIFLLCTFVEELASQHDGLKEQLEKSFQDYLQVAADEENEGVEATCENCGQPCEYDSGICICEDCEEIND